MPNYKVTNSPCVCVCVIMCECIHIYICLACVCVCVSESESVLSSNCAEASISLSSYKIKKTKLLQTKIVQEEWSWQSIPYDSSSTILYRDALPMCVVTGRHMVLDDWCFCPVSKCPALYSEYVKFIEVHACVCVWVYGCLSFSLILSTYIFIHCLCLPIFVFLSLVSLSLSIYLNISYNITSQHNTSNHHSMVDWNPNCQGSSAERVRGERILRGREVWVHHTHYSCWPCAG